MSQFNPKEYWEERLSKNYDISGVGYLPLGKSFNNWMYRVRKNVFNYHIKKLNIPKENSSVLDIGSGTGFYIHLLEKYGIGQIMGVDLTETATNGLKEKFPKHHFEQVDISLPNMELKKAPFDLVTCFDVLFHIVDDKKFQSALKNISNVTKEQGYFIFSDNFADVQETATHHVSRTATHIRESLKKVGLEVIDYAPTFVLLNAPAATKNKLFKFYWNVLHNALFMLNRLKLGFIGGIVGAVLYPIEILLVRSLKNGPSTKIVVCKKTK